MEPSTDARPARAALHAHEALPMDEQILLGYGRAAELRRAAQTEHAAAMGPALTEWAAVMAEQHGPLVLAHHNVVRWPEAFMVARYGEAVEHWPDALSAEDEVRLGEMLRDVSELGRYIQPVGDLATARARFKGRPMLADPDVGAQLMAAGATALQTPAAATSTEGAR